MFEGFLEGTVGFLALLGAVALALRFAASTGRVVLGAAEAAAASGAAETSARRGDLTGLSEARAVERRALQGRRRSIALSLIWALWLVVPLALGGVQEGWALAAPLWLVPRQTVRGAGIRGGDVRM